MPEGSGNLRGCECVSIKMNPVEHHSTVDRGLKMKIKRKNASKTDAPKHEIIKSDPKGLNSVTSGALSVTTAAPTTTSAMASPNSTLDKLKQTLVDKERDRIQAAKQPSTSSQNPTSPFRNSNKRKPKSDNGNGSNPSVLPASLNVGMDNTNIVAAASGSSCAANGAGNGSILPASSVMVELHRMNTVMGVKKEPTPSDPYEFNAKEEDRIGLPIVKKVKVEKMDDPISPGAAHSEMDLEQRDVGTETSSVGVATDPDCLGPCEPGTSVVLEGIVWNETENGILVVNITWRGKTYVGTLMDATKHAWAPPRFNCDSPAANPDARPCRGRGKRGRAPVTPPVIDLGERRLRKRKNNTNPYAAPPSPAKSECNTPKRRGRPADLDLDLDNIRTTKRARTTKNSGNIPTPENGFIECPEPNCSKKYRHVNGLRYHQAHAHKNDFVDEEMETEVEVKTPAEESVPKSAEISPTGKPGRGRKTTTSASSQVDCQSSDAQNNGEAVASVALDVKPEPIQKSGKKGKKEDKQANLDSKKQLEKQPTVALTQVNLEASKITTSTSSPTTSSYATSTMSPLSCGTTVVSSAAGFQSTSTTSTTSAVPVAMTTVIHASEKPKKVKGEKSEKKNKSSTGRINAPSTIAVAASVASPAQISIAASLAPSNTGLKPIQPKPTVLGETNLVNPAIAALKEQRKPKKKKNKDKDKDKESLKDKTKDTSHKDLTTIDMSVIQMTPMEKVPASGAPVPSVVTGNKSLEALVKMSTPPELQNQAAVQLGSTVDKTSGSPPELQKQMPLPKVNSPLKSVEGSSTRPPSSLSLNSPLANNSDNKDSSSTNAQSPAYSDISDANDSNLHIDNENAPVKVKEEPTAPKTASEPAVRPKGPSPSENSQQQQGFQGGMYGSYYPQTSFHSPSSTTSSQGSGRETIKPTAPCTPNKEADKSKPPVSELSLNLTPKLEKPEEKVKDRLEKEAGSKGSPTPIQMREYQERMMAAQHQAQQMAQYHQYMGAYGYGVDMRLLATNPEYKAQYEKWYMEQGRARREYMEQHAKMAKGADGKAGSPHDLSRPLDLNTKAMDLSKQGKGSPTSKPAMGSNEERNSPHHFRHEGPKNKDLMPDVRAKDKRCDLSQTEDNGLDKKDSRGRHYSGGSGNPSAGYDRQQDEYRRYYMYQQQQHEQRLVEHKRYMEHQKGESPKTSHPHSPMDVKRATDAPKTVKDCVPNVADLQSSYNNKSHHSGNRDSGNRDNLIDSRGSEHGLKSEKDKTKGSGAGSLPSSPAGGKPKDQRDPAHYGQYYQQQGYPGYPRHPPYESSQQMYAAQGGSNQHGYNQNSYPPYPPHMRGSFPEGAYKDGNKPATAGTPSPGGKLSNSMPHPQHSGAPEGKALELLQQKAATYYNTHSPHTVQKHQDLLKESSSAKSEKPSGNPGKEADFDSVSLKSAIVAGKEKVDGKDKDRRSPPTLRHVHTHHHTHLVGPAYSLYGPYGAMMATQQSGSASSGPVPYSPPK